MLIQFEINYWCLQGRLSEFWPLIPSSSKLRSLYISADLKGFLDGPWNDSTEEVRAGKLQAQLEMFVNGDPISIAQDPYKKPKSAYMARVDPVIDEVWDIRNRDPKPGVRVFGRFANTDLLIALTWSERGRLQGRGSRQWRDAREEQYGEVSSPHTIHSKEILLMTTSQRTPFQSEIIDGKKLSLRTLAYFRERLRNRLYSMVVTEFVKQGEGNHLTKAEMARRIGRKPEQITRWLAIPSNWTLDTVSDLLLSMGSEPEFTTSLIARKIKHKPVKKDEAPSAKSPASNAAPLLSQAHSGPASVPQLRAVFDNPRAGGADRLALNGLNQARFAQIPLGTNSGIWQQEHSHAE